MNEANPRHPAHRSAARPWVWVTLALLALAGVFAGAQHAPAPAAGPAAAVSAPAATGSFIDHSVLDRNDLLPEPDPSPMSVAAYAS
jgi:hypothetical protein